MELIAKAIFSAKYGNFTALYSDKGLCNLTFPSTVKATKYSDVTYVYYINTPKGNIDVWIKLTSEVLNNYFNKKPSVNLPPLDISSGTDFQKKVWNVLLNIPFGKTKTYGEIAELIGCPKGARAVGAACGANPIPIVIPCHRVIAQNGKLGGFSSGLKWKRLLLDIESQSVF